MILADFECPHHGVFEQHVPSPAPDVVSCPHVDSTGLLCAASSPWSPSPILHRVAVSASRGKSEKAPTPYHCDTTELGEGMPMGEWKAKRAKVWREWRHKQLKERGAP